MPKTGYSEGDTVEVTTRSEKITGRIMPGNSNIVLKLENGYNIGLDRKNVKKIRVVSRLKKAKKQKASVAVQKNRPAIAILHTGGTIASRVDYKTGGVIAHYTPDWLLGMFPELEKIANINTVFIKNIMSEDIRFSDYRLIARSILKEVKKGVKGVIVAHGTDTLAYTAAALAFIFDNLPIPVVLVGAQRSSDRGSSDAAMNLISAARFILETDFCGVAICMHETMDDANSVILPATRTRKMHTSRRDAFKAIGDTPIARIDYNSGNVISIKGYTRKNDSELVVRDRFAEAVGILKTHPNMQHKVFDFFVKAGYKGLVLEATGLGQAPTNIPEHKRNYEALKSFIKKGGVVALTSQCIHGAVHPFVYANCRRLHDIGVIFCEDMLTETAFIKLAWLLGNFPRGKVKELMAQNLKGEISKRVVADGQ